MTIDLAAPPPLLTEDLPGIGGRIKARPEDFEVEEIPAYQPCGSGEHLYLWVEKTGMGAEYFTRQVARRLGIDPRDVGLAGLKDRHAVTRQMVSVPGHLEGKLAALDGDGIRVLTVSRHTNKLKPGHLHGNKFSILIRDPDPGADPAARVAPVLDRLRREGTPNFYGPQRFGRGGETLHLGLAMLKGEPPPRGQGGRPGPNSHFLRKFAVSAAQAALFNAYLAARLRDGLFRRVVAGDVMSKWPAGGLFVAEDVPREQERFDARETVTTGPIFGKKTFAAQGPAAEREAAVLAAAGVPSGAFDPFGKIAQGTRRHNLIYADGLTFAAEEAGVRLAFALPAGGYATVLLREVMKADPADPDEAA